MLTREMKYSGVEWIGEIPNDWKLRRMKHILSERKIKNDPIITEEILSLSVERGVFPYSEKTGGGNKAKEDLTAYKVAFPGDIVINSMNILAGAVGLSKYKGAVSPVYYTLYDGKGEIDINYYHHLFQTGAFQRSLLGLGNGIMMKESSTGKLNTIRMRIPMEKLFDISLPLPPKNIQTKIVDFISPKVESLDKIIFETKQSIEYLKKYKQSIITQAITKGLDSNVVRKDSGIEWIGEVPEAWDVIKVNRLFSIKKEIANKTGYDVLSVTQRGLKVKDITQNEGQMAANYSKYQIVQPNDFVMNHMDLLTGWVDLATQEGVTSPDYRVFYNKQQELVFDRFYLYVFQVCYLNKIFYGLGQGVSNMGRWRLQTDKFLNFYLPLPPIEEQKEIVTYLNSQTQKVDSLIQDKEKVIEELEQYKKSLIYEYVTGKKEA